MRCGVVAEGEQRAIRRSLNLRPQPAAIESISRCQTPIFPLNSCLKWETSDRFWTRCNDFPKRCLPSRIWNPVTIEELAALCEVSASHFMRIFRVRLKMTAYSFVEQVRLHHAMESLKKGTTGITQIAIDCGFYDHSAFVKRFKKFTGTTPLNYRRQHQAAFANERPIVLPTPSK